MKLTRTPPWYKGEGVDGVPPPLGFPSVKAEQNKFMNVAPCRTNVISNPEVVGSIPTEVKIFFLYLVWFPDSLY